MATIRHHTRIARPADEVWSVVRDAGGIATWFPDIEQCAVDDGVRRCTLAGGAELVEDVVTVDDELRRFQYRITDAPFPVTFHLGTVDVLEVDAGALVVYSTEIEPDHLRAAMDPSIARGLEGLAAHLG